MRHRSASIITTPTGTSLPLDRRYRRMRGEPGGCPARWPRRVRRVGSSGSWAVGASPASRRAREVANSLPLRSYRAAAAISALAFSADRVLRGLRAVVEHAALEAAGPITPAKRRQLRPSSLRWLGTEASANAMKRAAARCRSTAPDDGQFAVQAGALEIRHGLASVRRIPNERSSGWKEIRARSRTMIGERNSHTVGKYRLYGDGVRA